jgi:hypothetical protein
MDRPEEDSAPAASTPVTREDLDAAALERKRLELRNSHWCVHPTLGLGMIGELGSEATFHRYRAATKDEPAGVQSEHQVVDPKTLRKCTPDELPEHLGYTEQQLKDFGYL